MVDADNKRIKVLDKGTKAINRIIPLDSGMNPLAVVAYGRTILVSDRVAHTVKVMDISTAVVSRVIGTGKGSEAGELNHPSFMIVHAPLSAQPLLLVADYFNHRVCLFDLTTGAFVRTIGLGRGSDAGQLQCPYGMAVYHPKSSSEQCLVFVCDSGNHRVQAFDLESGSYVRSVGYGRGTADGQFSYPTGLAIHSVPGAEAILAVADYDNHRVQIFSLSGNFIRVIGGGEGQGLTELCSPYDVVVWSHSGGDEAAEVVISDQNNHRLQVFDLHTGEHKRIVGTGRGSAEGEFNNPRGLYLI